MRPVSLLFISSCQSVTCLPRLMDMIWGGKIYNNYLLLPHAIMLCWVLIIMEQSTPHTTLWASNSTGKHTCCGQLWVSWVPCPRRPYRQEHRPNNQYVCWDAAVINQWHTLQTNTKRRILRQTDNNQFIYYTIVSSSPGKYFSFIGHSEYMGSTTRHLNQLIAEESFHYLGLSTKTERDSKLIS